MSVTYDFGNGQVPAHRHVNPNVTEGGWVADSATVGVGAYVGVGATVGEGATVGVGAPNYLGIRDLYRATYPHVPVVENLDKSVLDAVTTGELEMSDWHTCETTHCRAGWAVHLAGKAGYELESKIGPAAAGGLIYRVSTGMWPDFYAGNAEAMADIRRWAKCQE